MTTAARPDNSHLYAVAYAEVKNFAECHTVIRQPRMPRTVLAAAMLEVVDELMAEGVRMLARGCVAEKAGKTFVKIAGPLPFEERAALDQCIAEMLR